MKNFNSLSIKIRVVAVVSLVFLGTLIIALTYSKNNLRTDILAVSADQQESIVNAAALHLNQDFNDRLSGLVIAAKLVNQSMIDNPTSLQANFKQRPVLQLLFNDGLYLIKPDGTILTDQAHRTQPFTDQASINAVLKGQVKSIVGPPILDAVHQTPIFLMVSAIYDEHGQVIGALVGSTSLAKDNFIDTFVSHKYGKTGGFIVVDIKHRIIVSATDRSRIMEHSPAPGKFPFIDRFLSGYEGSGFGLNPKGIEVLESSAKIPLSGWQVIAALPTKEIFSPIRGLNPTRFLIAIIITFIAIFTLTWLSLRKLFGPLTEASKTITLWSENPESFPNQNLVIHREDEIGTLIKAFNRLLTINREKKEKLIRHEEIEAIAFYDPLTNLPNRRLLTERLHQALNTQKANEEMAALLFLDIDHFKTLNDTLGHDIGDLLLQIVASRLTNSVRKGDTVARLGGDEFVVLLEGLNQNFLIAVDQTETIGNKILASLNQPYQLNNHKYFCSSSIGITLFNGHVVGINELFKQADIAMYQSKTEGRNRMSFFLPKMQEAITARVRMENDLRNAIEKNELQLHYQIQVDHLGQPIGAEALIRWNHSNHYNDPPKEFIKLAEESSLIILIGNWVIKTACTQLYLWQQDPLTKNIILSVNISAKQFHQENFVSLVQEAIINHGIDANFLRLELTETILLKDIDSIIAKMEFLKGLGVKFSIDDFGTGYSSLQHLKKLPLSQLKIDQIFVREILENNSDYVICQTIIAMAKSLGLSVIAEGVETEEQMKCLMNIGCLNFQGYLFGRPMPIEEFQATLH